MNLAHTHQKFQDWFTQQWVIFRGKRIDPEAVPWLMGPFGNVGSIADDFVLQLAATENLIIERNSSRGLVTSIDNLNLSNAERSRLPQVVIDFYEKTTLYSLTLSVQWNPVFKVFGKLIMNLFSNRIKQLNIPTHNIKRSTEVTSEIITLNDPQSGEVKYTLWYRTVSSTQEVLYSGIYSTCTLPSGKICVKAVFPLPNGNATVIMSPSVTPDGKLRLDSSGEKFGDPGFYFLLKDSNGKCWAQYIRSFRDYLIIHANQEKIYAGQTLTLWHQRLLNFTYEILRK